MNFICPTLGKDHKKDFLVMGKMDDFMIIVFSDIENYNEGFKYLELADYEPCEVSIDLFKELSKNDDEFSGIILNIHSDNKKISKEEILKL